ncbi:MAG TPA: hypothetical protein VMT00_11280 [Thermoanaerobaculia bacterium]|nr:hypothetical protein [Thermoanaerobaculia bacterium]
MRYSRLLLGLAVVLLVPAAYTQSLSAPTITQCDLTEGDFTVSWDEVSGATKYAVEVVAVYDVGGGCPGEPVVYEDTTLDTTYSGSVSDYNMGSDPIGLVFRVKALDRPAKGSTGRQNNPFSECTLIVAPTCE